MSSVVLREFRESDRDAVIRLWETCGLTRPWNDPALDIDRKVRVGDSMFVVAIVDDRVVGAVMAGYDGHRGSINYLAADPGLRGRGIGTVLMAEAERRLASLGCPKVNLQVRRTNVDAVAFYERLGYVDDDVIGLGKRLVDDG